MLGPIDTSLPMVEPLGLKIGMPDLTEAPAQAASGGDALSSFGEMLGAQLGEVNRIQQQADQAVQTFAVGGPIELHDVMIASERASVAMDLTLQLRNKLVAAYQELSRINV